MTLYMTLSELSGDVHLNTIITGVVEIPADFIVYFIMTRIGRKPAFIGVFTTSALFILASVPFELIPGRAQSFLFKC